MKHPRKKFFNLVWLSLVVALLELQAAPALGRDHVSPSIEIKPVPTMLSLGSVAKDLRGTMGFGAGIELPIARKMTLFGDASFLQVRLSDNLVESWYKDENDDADEFDDEEDESDRDRDMDNTFFRNGTFIESKIGARYYTSPGADSWYAQAALGYELESSRWLVVQREDDEDGQRTANVRVDRARTDFILGGGYRWIFGDAVLLRVGANLNTMLTGETRYRQTSGSDAVPDAKAKVRRSQRANHYAVKPSLELGLGYSF